MGKGDLSETIEQQGQSALDLVLSAPIPDAATPSREVLRRKEGRINMAQVEQKAIAWLWTDRIARGKFTILDGDPDKGKSLITVDLAARLSRGRPMPCDDSANYGPSNVLFMACEDDPHDTVAPRLAAAGADLARVELLDALLSIPEKLDEIAAHVRELEATALIIDPLNGYLSGRINTNNDHQVRSALIPLAQMAQRLGVAVIGIRHFNKQQGGRAIHRGGGSMAYVGVARSAFAVGVDPEDEGARILAPVKGNIVAQGVPSLRFRIVGTENKQPRVEWLGPCDVTADRLSALPESEESRSALDHACDFLREALADGPVWKEELIARAKEHDLKPRTLERAKARLKVRSNKAEGKGGRWSWVLDAPDPRSPAVQPGQLGDVGGLGDVPMPPSEAEAPGR